MTDELIVNDGPSRLASAAGSATSAVCAEARVEEPSYFIEGDITGPDGEVLTTAEARWRVLG